MNRTLGLLINPVAGVGGPAGLKGSDGEAVQALARTRGSAAHASERGIRALQVIAESYPDATIFTAAGSMGADAVTAAGLRAHIAYTAGHGQAVSATTARDTVAAAAAIEKAGADLILFVGGDGTARDVASALSPERPILGVPAGVKMYSGCFAVSPTAAGVLATRWLGDEQIPLTEREVLDVDEEQIRHGRVDPKLFALVQVPFVIGRTQSRKSATPVTEAAAVHAAARGAVAAMNDTTHYLLGPGGTTREIARQLGVEKTPLGVDVVCGGSLILADASERQLLELVSTTPAKAIVTVIGGQGFLLGRGNQQISASVVAALGRDPLLVVATEQKLALLLGQPLLVDTGNAEVDRTLAGYIRVITGVGSSGVYPVTAPEVSTEEKGAQPCV
ncbi:ATP-NAD kinase family protein [Glaciibacter psychrotolerans]|uniref:Putative polyphosphate/ATP-dependent NAD kinase n=1 Tax=Glaciibacter psychrotolerans TaxID=670054 RepID=A0A7Z0EF73_9MICO|nr:NAD(+)/NADH kinase [Leifsonia psychrotolerans]NYJ20416.1 putative polyphosphate/ATP-dependent NAD kinase [Leifsonia psychrotolerans]